MQEPERPFAFLRVNRRPEKPRRSAITEIRGPYCTPMGRTYLSDLLDARVVMPRRRWGRKMGEVPALPRTVFLPPFSPR
jgi:hypothetical protein